MKLFDQYHDRYKCKGHTKENTFFRLVGLILFVMIWSAIWVFLTNSVTIGILCGIATTIFLDIVGGIGRRNTLFKG